MTSRSVNINYEGLPDQRVIAWLEANGIKPSDVPAAQEVLIHDGHELSTPVMAFTVFDRDADGQKIMGSFGSLKHIRVIPMRSAPENHNL